MEIQEFKKKYDGATVELIDATEMSVILNPVREVTERRAYMVAAIAKMGLMMTEVTGRLITIGASRLDDCMTAVSPVPFAQFHDDYEQMLATLQRRVDDAAYVRGAIESTGLDVREAAIERMCQEAVADIVQAEKRRDVLRGFENTSCVVFFSTRVDHRNVRYVAVAGAGWYKVTFAKK